VTSCNSIATYVHWRYPEYLFWSETVLSWIDVSCEEQCYAVAESPVFNFSVIQHSGHTCRVNVNICQKLFTEWVLELKWCKNRMYIHCVSKRCASIEIPLSMNLLISIILHLIIAAVQFCQML